MTFADDLLEAAGDEPIVQVVIGDSDGGMDCSVWPSEWRFAPGLTRQRELLTWAEAQPFLDYDDGVDYDVRDDHAVYAWTPTRVLFVVEHDGTTQICSAPRNPVAVTPESYGG